MPDMNEKQHNAWWMDPMKVFIKTSAWVAVPIIGALFLGRYLDDRFATAPWIFLGLTALAFVCSCYGIIRETLAYMRDIEKEHGHNNDTTSN